MIKKLFNSLKSVSATKNRPSIVSAFGAAIITLLLSLEARANPSERPKLVASAKVVIESDRITLGQLAKVTSDFPEYDKLVAKLKALDLGAAPPPRMSTTIPGVKIIELIKDNDIDLETLGYSIPQSILVIRGGQVIHFDQVLPEVRRAIAQNAKLDLQVREVSWENGQIVPSGKIRFDVEMLGKPQRGNLPLRVAAFVNERPAARFLATAIVDDWREVPVLNKTIERGMLISPSDVELIRLNLFKQAPDIADSSRQVVGRRAKNTLAAGSTIKKSLIDIPPIIPQGKRVKMTYNNGALQASAIGKAMEDGFEKSIIRLKNINTRRVVEGRVVSPDEVEVNFQ